MKYHVELLVSGQKAFLAELGTGNYTPVDTYRQASKYATEEHAIQAAEQAVEVIAALRGDSGFIAGVPLESTVMQED